MKNMITYRFNGTISESHSLLMKLLHVCMYLPKQDRECLKEHFSTTLSSSQDLLSKLPLGITQKINHMLDSFLLEIENMFIRCSIQRMSIAYIERAEAEKLVQEGIRILNTLNSTRDINKAFNTFESFRNSVAKKNQFDIPSSILPCNLNGHLENGHRMVQYVVLSFNKNLEMLRNRLDFHERMDSSEI